MVLWIGLAVMSAAVLAALLRPLLRPVAVPAHADSGSDIYRDQLAEIEAERERGLLGDADAEAARAEIARRLLASADRHDAAPSGSRRIDDGAAAGGSATPARLALILGGAVPVAAIAIYLALGAPHLPGQPLAARLRNPTETARIDQLIGAVEARLRLHPDDGEGWDVISPVYMKQGRYREAADAFARALRLRGDSARRLAGFAESTVLANDGIVTEPAREAYEKLVKLEPGRIEPRFWLALAKEQDGQLEASMTAYEALLREAPAEATWRPLVTERLDEVRKRLGRGSAPKPSEAAKSERGPSAADVAAAERLSLGDRQQMIEGMVKGLAERLKANGRDLAGWERLIRAYSVMGRRDEAVAALGEARNHFTSEPQSLARLAELARSLGLDS